MNENKLLREQIQQSEYLHYVQQNQHNQTNVTEPFLLTQPNQTHVTEPFLLTQPDQTNETEEQWLIESEHNSTSLSNEQSVPVTKDTNSTHTVIENISVPIPKLVQRSVNDVLCNTPEFPVFPRGLPKTIECMRIQYKDCNLRDWEGKRMKYCDRNVKIAYKRRKYI